MSSTRQLDTGEKKDFNLKFGIRCGRNINLVELRKDEHRGEVAAVQIWETCLMPKSLRGAHRSSSVCLDSKGWITILEVLGLNDGLSRGYA